MEKIDYKENLIRLIDEYQNLIFSICLKLTGDYFTAEDLAQETFIAAYRNMGVCDQAGEKAWLCRIAVNKCIDYKREAARRMIATSDDDMPTSASLTVEEEPLQEILNKEFLQEFKACCKGLPEKYQAAALGYFVEGKTAREISESTGIGLKTVQTRILRAKSMLKKFYRKELLKQ